MIKFLQCITRSQCVGCFECICATLYKYVCILEHRNKVKRKRKQYHNTKCLKPICWPRLIIFPSYAPSSFSFLKYVDQKLIHYHQYEDHQYHHSSSSLCIGINFTHGTAKRRLSFSKFQFPYNATGYQVCAHTPRHTGKEEKFLKTSSLVFDYYWLIRAG